MVIRLFAVIVSLVCVAGFIPGRSAATSASSTSPEIRQRAWQVIEQTWEKGDSFVGYTLVSELWRLDDPRVRAMLMAALRGEKRGLQFPAAVALRQRPYPEALSEMAKAMVGSTDVATRLFLLDALRSSGYPNLARRMVPLLHDTDPKTRWVAAGDFSRLEEQAINVAMEELSNPDPAVRQAALWILRLRADRSPLKTALSDTDLEIRLTAARALASVGDPAGVSLLAAHLEREPKAPDRFRVALLLSQSGDMRGTAFLQNALRQSDPNERASAASNLSDSRVPQASAILMDLLRKDPDHRVRGTALKSLLRINGDSVEEALQQALQDRSESVRLSAASEFLARGDSRGEHVLRQALGSGDQAIKFRAAELAPKFLNAGDEITLALMLRDDERSIQGFAMRTAAKLGIKALLPGIREVLMRKQEFGDHRMNAAAAIGDLGGPEAEEILRGALDAENPVIRVVAAIAILRPPQVSPGKS